MDNTNSQAETQTPKYKIGDVVWVPILGEIGNENEMLFAQTTIIALVYSSLDGKSTFMGYQTAKENPNKVARESAVFATRAEIEALLARFGAEIKAEKEGK